MQSLRIPAQTDPAFAPSAHCGVQRQAESTNLSLFTPSTLPSQYRHTPMSHCSLPPRYLLNTDTHQSLTVHPLHAPFSVQTLTNLLLFTPSTLPSQYRHSPMSHRSPPPRLLLNTDTNLSLLTPSMLPSQYRHTPISHFSPPPHSLLSTDTHQSLTVHPLHTPFLIQTHFGWSPMTSSSN